MKKEAKDGILTGLIIALIPHAGCLIVALLAIVGVGVGGIFLKGFIATRWFFPVLIIFSLVIAGLSTYFYFKRNCCVHKGRFLSFLLINIVLINTLMYFVVFPWLSNVAGGQISESNLSLKDLRIKVDIPCTGHAPLIVSELKNAGAVAVAFSQPDIFEVKYDHTKLTKEEFLSNQIFQEFKATEIP